MQKTFSILILCVFSYMPCISQGTIQLTFTAENNGQYVPLDSILIENLTQGGETTLYAPDTVLSITIQGVNEHNLLRANSFWVSQNYPNPFNGKTTIELFLAEKQDIKISIRDILGRGLAYYENALNRGNHAFSFYSGNEKYYLLTVTGNQTSKTIKMLNANSITTYGGTCKIVYIGYDDKVIGFKSQKAINNFGFDLGDTLQYTGYANAIDGIFGSAVIDDTPQTNTDYVFSIIKGLRCPGTATVTDIDSNTYNTVQIGSQCLMKENLKTTTYQDGTPIPNVTNDNSWSNLITGAYVWYDNDISWKGPYGAMYNWYATVDAKGLCPTGWHVPTVDEWTVLTDYIGGIGSPHGNELKSCRQVDSPLGGGCNTNEHPRWSQDNNNWGTDDYGFSGLPGGYRNSNGPFFIIGNYGFWWSSTDISSDYAWCRSLNYSDGNVGVATYTKQNGNSVRCLKDN